MDHVTRTHHQLQHGTRQENTLCLELFGLGPPRECSSDRPGGQRRMERTDVYPYVPSSPVHGPAYPFVAHRMRNAGG